jgi:hypothetical protein
LATSMPLVYLHSLISKFFFTSLVVISFFDNRSLSLSFVACLCEPLTRKYPHVLSHPESSLLCLHEAFPFLLRILQRFGKGYIALFSLLWATYSNANTLRHRIDSRIDSKSSRVESIRYRIEPIRFEID